MCCFDEFIGDNDYKYFLLPVAECMPITEHFKIFHAKKVQQKIQSGHFPLQSRTKISKMSIDFSVCLFVGDLCRSFDKHEFMTWVLIQEMYYKDSGERKNWYFSEKKNWEDLMKTKLTPCTAEIFLNSSELVQAFPV